jgi:hypothetical protein
MKDIPINFIPKVQNYIFSGTVRTCTSINPLKPLIKSLKDKVFVSFNMEFKLKYYKISPKTIIIYYCDSGTVRACT